MLCSSRPRPVSQCGRICIRLFSTCCSPPLYKFTRSLGSSRKRDNEAQRFYKSGRPFLEEHLPFWIATLVEKVLVVFVPLAILLYPVFKLLPKAYDWLMQSRILRLYDEMRSIENEIESTGSDRNRDAINEKLDQLHQRANQLRLPTTYASALYTLRSHLDIVRARLSAGPDRAR
jgi:hypothetical protein